MKPLALEFSGLHSYRDKQKVDFEELGRAGLFGIFGPTGSGKSSILDAITLALYGQVDRAHRGTTGIINQREQYADVSLSFELGGTRYTVKRRYERSERDSEGVRVRVATLSRADGTVLADRADTVTKAVEQLLGFTFKEFCKAVVLPQGKFDQFLRLSGAEKAEMLGHIFDLDKFGDPLYRAATERESRARATLDSIEMTRKRLGDCSDEAIERAEAESRDREAELKEAESRLSDVRARLDEAGKVRELYGRLKSAMDEKLKLDERKSEIDRYEASLDRAKRAEPLKDLMATVERLSRDRDDCQGKLRDASAKLEKVQAELCSAEERLKQARERKEREEPILLEKRARFEQALETKKDLNERRERWKTVSEELSRIGNSIEKQKKKLTEGENLLKELEAEVRSLESKEKELLVDADFRSALDEAIEKLNLLEESEQSLRSEKDDLALKREETERARSHALAVFAKLAEISASRYSFDDDGELRVNEPQIPDMTQASSARELLAVAGEETRRAARLVQEAVVLVQQAILHDQAVLLAASLKEGSPCPVCGSSHHPNPASGPAEKQQRAEEARRILDKCQQDLGDWYRELEAAASEWESYRRIDEEAGEKCKSRESALTKLRDDFRKAAHGVLGDAYDETRAGQALRQLREEVRRKDREHASVGRKLDDARMRERLLKEEVIGLQKGLAELEKERESRQTELNLVDADLTSLQRKLAGLTGGEDPSAVLSEVTSTLEQLKNELAEAEKCEKDTRDEVERLRHEETGLRSSLRSISAELEKQAATLSQRLSDAGFGTLEEAREAALPAETVKMLEKEISTYREELARVTGEIERLRQEISGRVFSEEEFQELQRLFTELDSHVKRLYEACATARANLGQLRENRKKWDELEEQRALEEKRRDLAAKLASLIRGKSLVTFLASEYLRDIAADASVRLGSLTGQRYALEISEDGAFTIRDDFNGGARRSVGTLSGGEMFLTSLALALALSSRVQLRGRYPLGFFFLDEGFGTLDEEKLDAVIGALEKLQNRDRMVGVISHVRELKERLPCYLEVLPAGNDGTGSRVVMRRR